MQEFSIIAITSDHEFILTNSDGSIRILFDVFDRTFDYLYPFRRDDQLVLQNWSDIYQETLSTYYDKLELDLDMR